MKIVITLLLVFMASALGGWFGFRVAAGQAEEGVYDSRASDLQNGKSPGGKTPGRGTASRIDDLAKEIAVLRSSTEERFARIEERIPALAADSAENPANELFEARAEAQEVVLTDQGGREVRVEILAVGGEKVSVRRVSDRREFDIPFDWLIEDDRDFLEYVREQGGLARNDSESRGSAPSSEEVDFDAIFNSFGN